MFQYHWLNLSQTSEKETHSSVGIGQNIVLRLFEKASISLANVYPKAFAFLKEKIITQK